MRTDTEGDTDHVLVAILAYFEGQKNWCCRQALEGIFVRLEKLPQLHSGVLSIHRLNIHAVASADLPLYLLLCGDGGHQRCAAPTAVLGQFNVKLEGRFYQFMRLLLQQVVKVRVMFVDRAIDGHGSVRALHFVENRRDGRRHQVGCSS